MALVVVFQGSITKALGSIRVGRAGDMNGAGGPMSGREPRFHPFDDDESDELDAAIGHGPDDMLFPNDESMGSSPTDSLPPPAPVAPKSRRQRNADTSSPDGGNSMDKSFGPVCNPILARVGIGSVSAGGKHVRGMSIAETADSESLLTVTPV